MCNIDPSKSKFIIIVSLTHIEKRAPNNGEKAETITKISTL